MTDEPAETMTDESSEAQPANSNFAVLAAIAELGLDATPAAIANKVGIAYSTVNPKLRAWETAGLAERFRHDNGQTLWRLTDAGRASTATPSQFAAGPAAAETIAEEAANTATTPACAAEAVLSQPAAEADSAVAGDNSDGGPKTPDSAPAPAASDTDVTEPTTADTPGEADLGGGEEPDRDSTHASIAPDAATQPVDSGPAPAPAAPAVDEAAAPAEGQGADAGTPTSAAVPGKRRRPKGALKAIARAVLQANPDGEYKIDRLKKLIDLADADTGYPLASHGAVANAVDKLAEEGEVVQVEGRKAATFRAAPTAD